jgi:hypothetical protein
MKRTTDVLVERKQIIGSVGVKSRHPISTRHPDEFRVLGREWTLRKKQRRREREGEREREREREKERERACARVWERGGRAVDERWTSGGLFRLSPFSVSAFPRLGRVWRRPRTLGDFSEGFVLINITSRARRVRAKICLRVSLLPSLPTLLSSLAFSLHTFTR